MVKEVNINENKDKISIENEFVKYTINTRDGTYTGMDKITKTNIFEDAQMRLDDNGNKIWNISSNKFIYSWEQDSVEDKYGKGKVIKLFQELSRGYKPIWILTITLYEDKPFAVLGWGVKNHQSFAMRVSDIEPLFGGELFVGQKADDFWTLRGGAGAEPTMLQDYWEIDAMNSAMLTYKNSDQRHTIVAGGLKYVEFARRVTLLDGVKEYNDEINYNIKYKGFKQMSLSCWDPQGKLVEPGTTYYSSDTIYLDISTQDPFISLEQYGEAMRIANDAKPNNYDFPTLCGWMISTGSLGEGKNINNSPGLVEQMDLAVEKGFMKYSKLAVRLEPDYYCYGDNGDTQQGWWDDEHWGKYNSLQEPYETFEKWCNAIKEREGAPFTYFQVSLPSNDFALTYPEWMLNNDISQLHRAHPHHRPYVRYDYTDPGFKEHTLNMWKRLQKEGMQGIKFDYPETGWAKNGGFEDPTYTTTSAYREIFKLCREGLGPNAFIHERNLGGSTHEDAPRLDITAGIVDLQRVWGDASHFEPEMASRMGLRWYKNRNVFSYYPDGKSLYLPRSKEPLPTYKRRTFLTVMALLSGRLELGTSIGSMTLDMIHDVTRLYPMIDGTQSPRPVDMFQEKMHPEVYVYTVNETWKQVMFIRCETYGEDIVHAPFSGDQTETGSLGFKEKKEYYVFDFWNQKFIGKYKGTDTLSVELKFEESVMYSIHEVENHPQIVSTNRHLMQGMMELHKIDWNNESSLLSGAADVIGGEDFILTIATNGNNIQSCTVNAGECSYSLRTEGELISLIDIKIKSKENQNIEFKLNF